MMSVNTYYALDSIIVYLCIFLILELGQCNPLGLTFKKMSVCCNMYF